MSRKDLTPSEIQALTSSPEKHTVTLDSGVSVTGVIKELRTAFVSSDIVFIKLSGPCQIGAMGKQFPDHGTMAHPNGFSSPIGQWHRFPNRSPALLSDEDLVEAGIVVGKQSSLAFASGFLVQGMLKSIRRVDGKLALMAWDTCRVTREATTFYEPEWGPFDMLVGDHITKVEKGAL